MKIQIVSGSPRTNSVTIRVALFLKTWINENTEHEVELIDLREDHLPPVQDVYTKVEEAPEHLRELATQVLHSDAFIIVTPEYNGSYSPSMQNLFDHFPKQQHKVFGIVTASPGPLGGIRAAMQLQQFIMALFGIPSPYMLIVPGVEKKFNGEGVLIDPAFQKSIDNFTKEFFWLAEKLVEEKVNA